MIGWRTYRNKDYIYVDMNNMPKTEIFRTVSSLTDIIVQQDLDNILLLVNANTVKYSLTLSKLLRQSESIIGNKIKKIAIVNISWFKKKFYFTLISSTNKMISHTYKDFKNEESACNWLIK
jgi:hypothetical protein